MAPPVARLSALRAAALIAALAIGLSWLFAQTTLYARIALDCEDIQQSLLARPHPFARTLVFDVDDESMQRLEKHLGPWPYDREIYALVADWLLRSGASSVAFDILFSEARGGDAELAKALDARAVLAAAPLPYPLERPSTYHQQLNTQHIEVGGLAGQFRAWSDITLPRPLFTPAGGARAGMIAVVPDADGVVRRVALLHEAYGQVLPSLPLAALLAANGWPALSMADSSLGVGELRWPMTDSGAVTLRFPSNLQDQTVYPFYRLALAAAGAPEYASLAQAVRGKMVFVGSSSAVLGDYVHTPLGRRAGLYFVAFVAEMLAQGNALRPPSLPWNALVVALALVLPMFAVGRGLRARPRDHALGLTAALVLPGTAGLGLFAAGQLVDWPFAILSGLLSQFLGASRWQFMLYRQREFLRYETLAAQNASRMKTDFLNQMTHELRTPVTAIMGFNKVIGGIEDLGRFERIRIAGVIARNCEHMLALVNNHLDLARIEAGQLAIERRPASPVRLAEDALDTLRPVAGHKGLELKLEIQRTPPEALLLDSLRVRQILLNLLGNAVKFTEQGQVSLLLDWDGDALLMTVSDTGPGIPPEALGRVFEAFEQAGRNERATGSGLGLTITRRLVDLMDGKVGIESRVGTGTRMTVRLPATTAAAPATEPVAPAPTVLRGRVLVAEDNPDLRELLQKQLSEFGCAAEFVGDGVEAVAAATGGHFDLVLMDMEMPRMKGDEAVRALRARGYAQPVLAFTAHGDREEQARIRSAGFDDLLEKPVSAEDLAAALRRFIAQPAPANPGAGATLEPIVVRLKSVTRELAPRYLERCRADVARMKTDLDRGNFDALRGTGHMLKGTGGSYGFDEMTQIAAGIESAAGASDRDRLQQLMAQLENYLERVRPEYE